MTPGGFGKAAVQRFREQQHAGVKEPSPLDLVPADAPADDETITVWNGERFVNWSVWRAHQPTAVGEAAAKPDPAREFADAQRIWAKCGSTLVMLANEEGERWVMYVGSLRRRDFATPFLAHAIRTAEFWFGPATAGWQREESVK